MANVFKFTITAVDKATAIVRGVRQSIDKATQPLRGMQASVKALGKEAGVEKLTKSVGYLGKTFGSAATQAAGIAPELEAIVGLGGKAGAVGVVVALAAGLGVLAVKTADFAFDIKRTSTQLGLSTTALQSWRGAAGAMGIEAQSVDGSLMNLGDTLQDAFAGRNNQALFLFQRLGLVLKRTKDGAIDVNDELLQLADVMAKFKGNPEIQRLITRQLGVDPALIPILSGGRKQTQKYLDDAAKRAIPDKQVEEAAAFDLKIKHMGQALKAWMYRGGAFLIHGGRAMGGFGNAAFRLAGSAGGGAASFFLAIPALVNRLGRLGDGLQGLVAFLKSSWSKLTDLVDPQTALQAAGSGFANSPLGRFVQNAGDIVHRVLHPAAKFADVQKFFQGKGWTPQQAAGIAANLQGESSFDPTATNKTSRMYGLAQWDTRRRAAFAKLFGHDIRASTMDEQLNFVNWELLQGGEQASGRALKQAFTASQAARIVNDMYERNGVPGAGAQRGALAEAAMSGGAVQVDVNVKHDGHSAHVRTRSQGNVRARGKVEHSLSHVPA